MSSQMKLDMNTLHTGLYFQKEPNPKRVQQIVSEFDWERVQPLDISYRDGKYNVVNGQHRLFAIRKKFANSVKPVLIPCCVRTGLTEIDEMKLFSDLARGTRSINNLELFKSDYGRGVKEIVEMVDMAREIGFIVDFTNSKSKNRITVLKDLLNIYSELNNEDYKKFLKLIKDTWDGDSISLQKDFLLGVFEFYRLYKYDFDNKRFKKQLTNYSPNDIKRVGETDRLSGKTIGCAKAIFIKYNQNLKVNRLQNKF